MKILNLANEGTGTFGGDENSVVKTDIRFKIKHFPDGQTDIVINSEDVIPNTRVQITSHFNSAEDMFRIICARVALNKLQIDEIHLFIPYILGARSDRRFEKGGTSYLVEVVAPTINNQKFKTITCFDAHSEVAQACIERLDVMPNYDLVQWALNDINSDNFVIAAPDQGASKKIFSVAHELKIETPILFCVKHRDQVTGKILHTEVPIKDCNKNMDFIIVDDICDGGRTFIEIAKEIKRQYNSFSTGSSATENGYRCRIFLVVSHGIFSQRFDELNKYIDGIYTTNSISCYGWDIEMFQKPAKNLHVKDIIQTQIKINQYV